MSAGSVGRRQAAGAALLLAVATAAAAWAQTPSAPSASTAAAPPPVDGRRSGWSDMSPELQAMQRDDRRNPGMQAVDDGAELWRTRTGAAQRSCAGCHGDALRSMAGVAARYPAWDTLGDAPLSLSGRINACRQRHQQAKPLDEDDDDMLALAAFVGRQSRGLPIAPPGDPRLTPLREQGRALWQQRLGQLNLACTQCHDGLAGQRLGSAVIPQGHPTGYPLFRLKWDEPGSLQRRMQGCLMLVRAEAWRPDAPQWLALEAFLAQRAAGMPVETPALRP